MREVFQTSSSRHVGPDFIGIGAQKAGTSWLLHQLSKHPGIFTPITKELHFFNGKELDHPLTYVGRSRLTSWHGRFYRLQAGRSFNALREAPLSKERLRLAAYHFGPRTLGSYQRVFAGAGDRLCGEFTPDYGPLDESTIRFVVDSFPSAKFLLILRSPVERRWSNILHVLRATGRSPGEMSSAELMAVLDDDAIGDYRTIIGRWERHLEPGQLGIFFYDDLVESPQRFYRDVLEFIGADPDFVPDGLTTRVHETRSMGDMPPEVERWAATELESLTTWLVDRFPGNGHVEAWHRRVQEVLDGSPTLGQDTS